MGVDYFAAKLRLIFKSFVILKFVFFYYLLFVCSYKHNKIQSLHSKTVHVQYKVFLFVCLFF